MSAPLPPFIVRLIHLVAPERARAQIVRDLAEDYAARGGEGHYIWLLRECASVLVAYTVAHIQGVLTTAPVWSRDLRMALRGLRRTPLAALGGAAMLAAGFAAVMLTAGLTQTLLLRPVSAVHGSALRRVMAVDRGRETLRVSFTEMQVIREHLGEAGVLTAVNLQPAVMRVERDAIQTMAEVVAGPYFTVTGVRMRIGRPLLTLDDRPGAPAVVVISTPFWQRHFAASPDAQGATVHLNGHPFTVVGVADALGSSSFLGASVDAWVAAAHADALLTEGCRTRVEDRWFTAFVLPAGSPLAIEARLDAAAQTLSQVYPEAWRTRSLRTSEARVVVGGGRANVMVLAAILTGLSLLIVGTAAANLGGVLLARAAAARRHAAIHLSLGAGYGAIVRRQLIEGVLLGLAGAALALVLYAWAAAALQEIALLPTLALRLELPFGSGMILGAAAGGALAGLLLAIGPAVWTMRMHLADTLREGECRTGTARGFARVRRLLVAAQVSLTIVLIVAAATFNQSLSAMLNADLGFNRDRLLAFDFDVQPANTRGGDTMRLAHDLVAKVALLPGVSAVAMSNRAPIDTSTPTVQVRIAPDAAAIPDVTMYLATAGYFQTVGVPLVAGRAFSEQESNAGARVLIVNESLARLLSPAGDALDRAIYIDSEAVPARVVGIARNSKYRSISEESRPHVYRPSPPILSQTLLVRTAGDSAGMLRTLQATFDTVGPGIVGFFPRTLDDHLAVQLLPTKAAAAAAGVLGGLALVLSGFGLYGLVSWFVELRRREIGIRMALGASGHNVRAMVLGQTLATALPGILVGIALAGALTLSIRGVIFGVQPLNLFAIAVALVALLVVVLVAAYAPSRRATLVDPALSLRS